MSALSLKKKDLPFLLGGKGEVTVDTGNLKLTSPIPEGAASLLNVSFKAGGDEKIPLGQDGTVKVAVSTKASISLTPVFSSSTGAAAKLLKTYGIGDLFKRGANSDAVVLCFEQGVSGDITAAGSFAYSALRASVQLDAGADAGYAYLRAFKKTDPVAQIVPNFFKTMRLPEQGTAAPEPGEAISLQYGGYLRLGAEVSAGYRLTGTKGFSIGQLALSEKYDLSIVGKIGLSAGIAGRFLVLVTAHDLPGWARVQVRRQQSRDMKVAADVNVGFKNTLDLPADAKDFLGAVLGVNAKNFLNVFRKAVELSDFATFEKAVDGLAKKYIEAFIGKGFASLSSVPEFTKFLATLNKVVTSYEQAGDRAVALFDKYFDQLDQLVSFLDKLQGLPDDGLATLRKGLSPQLWTILSQLADGDPLGFLLGQVTVGGVKVDSLAELKKRAGDALNLVRDDAHAEIRRAIALAKQQFGLDLFFRELAKVDTVDELQALATDKIGLFVTRLVGRALDSSTNVKQAFKEVHDVLLKIDSFPEKLFKAFKEAANSSYKVALHAEYSRASETDALVDVAINMNTPRGAGLLGQAGKGDFEEILTISDTDIVRLQEGVLTHHTRRASAFKVNILGWHLNYSYEGIDQLITDTEQRLVPSDQGMTVLTTTSLELDRKRKRQAEQVHINFLLRALGESAGLVKSDPRNLQYVIDTLASLSARYQLHFTDDDTSEMELRDYLSFAGDLGLQSKGATFAGLQPLLPRSASGSFGSVEASYDIRFGEDALKALLSVKQLTPAAEDQIRNTMRMMLLSNYLKSGLLHDVAFAYATPAIFERFRQEGGNFTNHSLRQFPVALADSAIAAPSSVNLDTVELNLLVTLYNIENSLVGAIQNLYKVLGGGKIDPSKFEKAMGSFGDAMAQFDKFDQTTSAHAVGTNSVFAMFDALVAMAANGGPRSVAVLRLKSQVGDREVEKLFLSDQAAAAS